MLNLTFLTHPLGEEISLAFLSLISLFLILWLISKIAYFKKSNYKTALLISILVIGTSFVIRSISLIFSLKDTQKPPINLIAMVTESFLLLVLIKREYNLKWTRATGIWLVSYIGKWMIAGFIAFIIISSFKITP